jgi:hypothetical protein
LLAALQIAPTNIGAPTAGGPARIFTNNSYSFFNSSRM